MTNVQLTREMDFVVHRRGLDETTILAQALREGVHKLYRETLSEDYVTGKISRVEAIQELGIEVVEDLEYQRGAFARDVAWGLSDA
jgi:hypothetical protein